MINPAEDLVSAYQTIRSHTETAASWLSESDQTIQSMPDASPTKWHRAHTTWFFDTFVLAEESTRHRSQFPGFDTLFNSYYESVGAMHPRAQRGLITRPGASDITRYREVVDHAVIELLGQSSETVHNLVKIGLQHEQQHLELLLMDIKHALFQNPLFPSIFPVDEPVHESDPPTPSWTSVKGGVVTIGQKSNTAEFGFDNERPEHRVYVDDFEIADHLTTNSEWLEFMADGGYARHELWLSAGWARVKKEQWLAPLYWIHKDGQWWHYTHHGLVPVDRSAPVAHISYFEADAYARWAGARPPTEAEWEHALVTVAAHPLAPPSDHPFGITRLSPHAALESISMGQAMDTVWQWTQSAYLPYPGFIPADGALGEYNGKFMSGQMVLRGGSCITPVGHTRLTYRNFFSPESRWLYSGIRLAR